MKLDLILDRDQAFSGVPDQQGSQHGGPEDAMLPLLVS